MMNNNWGINPVNYLFPGFLAGWLSVLIIPLALWSIFWMCWALWRAAKDDSKVWFIILLLVHTMGILDIIYIFLISKNGYKKGKRK
jgi:methionyl-tRNA synthetase